MRDGIPERPYKRLHHAGQNEDNERDPEIVSAIRQQRRQARFHCCAQQALSEGEAGPLNPEAM